MSCLNLMRRLLLVGVLAWSCQGVAQAVELRFAPAAQTLDVGEEGQLEVWLDDPIEVRTIELTVAYNGDVLQSISGGAGQAFEDLPCSLWEEFDDEGTEWYGFCVSMGATCYVDGPGPLYVWRFRGFAEGVSHIQVLQLALFDESGELIEDVTLAGTTVQVGNGMVGVDDLPGVFSPTLYAAPNPCNPRTVVHFWMPSEGPATVEVFDLAGRRVRRLVQESRPAAWNTAVWHGDDDAGEAVPSGVYVYRLATREGQRSGRVTLAR